MIHLTPADYRRQPWANGRGITTELYRVEANGKLIFRLSMATVSENGPFSLFPGIERNLTVLTGPGFTLTGDTLRLEAKPLTPVAFPGDVPVTASGVTAPSDDFNVMTARSQPRPEVTVMNGTATLSEGGSLAIFALDHAVVSRTRLHRHELILTSTGASISGAALIVRLSQPIQFD